jgi:hypothetical protein
VKAAELARLWLIAHDPTFKWDAAAPGTDYVAALMDHLLDRLEDEGELLQAVIVLRVAWKEGQKS